MAGCIRPDCGNERRKGGRWCKGCHAEWSRKHRKPLTGEAKRRANARHYLHIYVRRGSVTKSGCQLCPIGLGRPVEAHHPDYGKPLAVVWLCKEHHQELTNLERLASRNGSPALVSYIYPNQ